MVADMQFTNPIKKFQLLEDDILAAQGTNLAFFKGSLEPDLLIVGEAPGVEENVSGIPFVGRSGNLIDELIELHGLDACDLAFLNPVFRMPLDTCHRLRQPTDEEIDYYRPMTQEIVNFLSPKYVLLLGNTACMALLNRRHITRLRGNWLDNFLPTFHPSYVLRNPELRSLLESDVASIANKLLYTGCRAKQEPPSGHQKMMEEAKIRAIGDISEKFRTEIELVRSYIESDPQTSITKARKVLEMILSKHLPEEVGNLNDKIRELGNIIPSHVETQMHFIRKLGNTAVHSDESLTPDVARQTFEMLLSILCWELQVKVQPESANEAPSESHEKVAQFDNVTSNISSSPKPTLKARFFIADEIYRTWPKLAVLSEDGTLYCEYLAWMKPTIFKKDGLDFNTFKATDFSFGEGEHGNAYQNLREVSYQEAIQFKLKQQDNWVKRYLNERGINVQD